MTRHCYACRFYFVPTRMGPGMSGVRS